MLVFAYTLIAMALAAALAVTWKRRAAGTEPPDHVEERVKEAYAPELLFVSRADSAFVGLCFSKGLVVMGQGGDERLVPLERLARVELLYDDEVAASTDAVHSAPGPGAARVQSVSIRLAEADEDSSPVTVRFLAWRPPGLSVTQPAVRDAVSKAGLVFAKLAEGMARARTA